MADDVEDWEGGSPWLFLLGLVVFLGSGFLFLADLIRGVDILRAVGANAIGAGLLIVWAAQDTYSNPDSGVDSVGGAIGTVVVLFGLYLLGAGAIIAVTGLVHDRLRLGFVYFGGAVSFVLVGFFISFFTRSLDEQGDSHDADRSASGQNSEITGDHRKGEQ